MGLFKSKLLKSVLLLLVMILALSPVFVDNTTASTAKMEKKKGRELVIIDADMGELSDDTTAMLMLINSSKAKVLGVTIVPGSVWNEEGTAYALRQLELIHRSDIPVVQGAEEPLMGSRQSTLDAEQVLFGNFNFIGSYSRTRPDSYLALDKEPYGGYPTTKPLKMTAADFIVDQVKKHPHEVTIFATGPATNLALAVKTHPEIVPLVKQVIYMGGAIDVPGNTTPAAEFNWWYDPESIKIALKTPFKKQTVIPLDVSDDIVMTKDIFDRLVSKPETPIIKMYKDLWGPRFEKDPNYTNHVFDALTAAIFLKPEIATKIEERYIDIDTNYGLNYGRSIGYTESRNRDNNNPEDFPAGTQKVDILFGIDEEAFWDLYVDLMTKEVRDKN